MTQSRFGLLSVVTALGVLVGCKGEAGKVFKQISEVTSDIEGLKRAATCEAVAEMQKKLDERKAEMKKAKAEADAIEEATKHLREDIKEATAMCDEGGKPTKAQNDDTRLKARAEALNALGTAMALSRKNELGDPAACYESMKKLIATEDEENRETRCKMLKSDPAEGRALRTVSTLLLSSDMSDWTKLQEKKEKDKDDEKDKDEDKSGAKKADAQAREFLSDWKSEHCGGDKKDVPFKVQLERAYLAARVCLPSKT